VPSTATAPPTSPAAAPAGVDGPADVARPTETAEESGEAPKAIPGQPAALARPLTRGQLVERLNEAVVIIIAGASTGSGFFIGPDLVVSNSHVVEGAQNSEVIVGGRTLGWREGRVLARTPSAAPNSRDYSVIRVSGARLDNFLHFSENADKLEKVVAAGFPSLLLGNDMNFRAFLKGDKKAMPDLALSEGVIMARQNDERGLPTLAHSAAISGGNSGGPLVDGCGRVLGINTFIAVAAQQGTNAGFALASGDLMQFLRSKRLGFSLDSSRCEE
jgi:S1-C subfamily serine protease